MQPRRMTIVASLVAILVAACSGGTAPIGSAGATTAPATTPPSGSIGTGEPVEIRWYCCLGAGDAPEQVEAEQAVVDAFNASHPNIKLVFEAVPYQGARDALATQIASGNGPDIVGPVGVGGAEAFHGQWLDLGPLIAQTSYDLSQYASGAVDFYKIRGEGQPAIPFAIYPSFLWYEKGMFEEAGLNEPPHAYGEAYTWPDGTTTPWDYDTIRKLALKLTVDKSGTDATQAGFDPKSIVQYGFEPQRDDARGLAAFFGAGSLAGADGKTVEIPPAWESAWKWFYDATWKDHFTMTGPVFESEEYNGDGYSFCSGKVAMQVNWLWSNYCLPVEDADWDIAPAPAYQGTTTAPFNADTFRILKDSKHPNEAFEALTYLLGEGSSDLLTAYGGMPARTADQASFIEGLDTQFPHGADWQVAVDSIEYADNPNFEAYMPAYNETLDRLGTFMTKLSSEDGVDVGAEIATLKSDLQTIWDRSQ